jgi:hypothetical protein
MQVGQWLSEGVLPLNPAIQGVMNYMATQTKADRSAAGKKAAATRERNEKRAASKDQGRKAAASRFTNNARDSVNKARTEAGKAASSVTNVGKATAGAAVNAGRSVTSRAGLGGKKKK